jgi:hypothetical protein
MASLLTAGATIAAVDVVETGDREEFIGPS